MVEKYPRPATLDLSKLPHVGSRPMRDKILNAGGQMCSRFHLDWQRVDFANHVYFFFFFH